jgi:hypothetical protein
MVKVYSKALDKTIEVDRYIGKIKGSTPGPSVVFIAGMHGNEPSGVFALHQVLEMIAEKKIPVKGNIYALAGNLKALARGARFHRQDLNRLWSAERIDRLNRGVLPLDNDDVAQQAELYTCLQEILEQDEGPFYFMDLHTTSSETMPFVVLNDSLLNRKFTLQYPLPLILGIEEYLDGPLLSYINELGYVAFGFEAGQHDSRESVENQEAFIILSMVFTGCVAKNEMDFERYFRVMAKNSADNLHFYEIFFRYRIEAGEQFQMEPGYVNFQEVRKGQKLAKSNGKTILADRKANIFMPLYQSQGEEGFFAIRRVPRVFLQLSTVVRKFKIDRLLPLLPGVSWISKSRQALKVDRRVARFFTKQALHLMGYRTRALEENFYIIRNREAASREEEYKEEAWFR